MCSSPHTNSVLKSSFYEIMMGQHALFANTALWLNFSFPIPEHFCLLFGQIAQMGLILPRWGLILPRISPPTSVLYSAVTNPFLGYVQTQNIPKPTPKQRQINCYQRQINWYTEGPDQNSDKTQLLHFFIRWAFLQPTAKRHSEAEWTYKNKRSSAIGVAWAHGKSRRHHSKRIRWMNPAVKGTGNMQHGPRDWQSEFSNTNGPEQLA